MASLLAAIYCFQYFIQTISTSHSSVSKVFQNPDYQSFQPFQHMVVERQLYTGRVYIGGVNRLYQLSPELDLQARVETGPFEDSVDCPASRASRCDAKKSLTPNYNKALTVYAKQSKLIVCGSLYQGSCRLHKLYNITDAEPIIAEAIVANDQESSSVIFIAPGPPILQDALYVASTYPNQGKLNDELPAVATRSLDPGNFLKVAYRTINSETQMFLENTLRNQYRIEYVYGFSSGIYSYFMTRQPRYTQFGSVYHSKLARLCHGDQNYYSYTEVPLECVDEKEEYNLIQGAYLGKPGFDLAEDLNVSVDDDVLYAVFAKASDMEMNRSQSSPTRQSALCVYSVKQIEEKFMDNIRLCANGSMLRGLSFFKQEKPCVKTSYVSDILACGYQTNYPLGGNMPIRRRAGYTTNSVHLTAVAATTTHMYTVVFMGTDDGNLIKAVVESTEEVFKYDTVAVDSGRPILADLQFDMSGEHIYVMTAASISKVKVQECDSKYQRCSQCLGAKDPFCGWCSAENKCSIQGSCKRLSYYLPYKEAECTTITRVRPDKLEVSSSDFVVLEIQNLQNVPQASQLSCVFILNGQKLVTRALRGDNDYDLTCKAPEPYLRDIPVGRHATAASLSVQVDSVLELDSTSFIFYNCSSYKSCQDCASSDYPCDWCPESGICTSNALDRCVKNRWIINGLTRWAPSIRNGPSFCPQILPLNTSPIVYVPSGTIKALFVKVMNLSDFIKTSFFCVFEIGPHVHKRLGKRVGDRIECDPMDFTYFDMTPSNTAKFWVASNDRWTLENVENIHVVMYKCKKLATNCGLCLYLDTQYACGWCQGMESCTTEGQCKNGSWLDKSETCPGPIILNDPLITDFSPTEGPQSGGTIITILGEHLNVGSSVQVTVAGVPCQVTLRERGLAYCRTGASLEIKSGSLEMNFDAAIRTYADKQYSYVQDPSILTIKPLRSTVTGGIRVRVDGERFQLIQNATIYFNFMGDAFLAPCNVVRNMTIGGTATDISRSTYIRCWTPKIPISTTDRMYPIRNRPLLVHYGFIFDGIQFDGGVSVHNENKFSIYPDPTFSLFGKQGGMRVKYFRGDFLSLDSENLDLAVEKEDIEVFVGDKPCKVRALTSNELICKPPSEQPTLSSAVLTDRFSSDGLPEVSVRVGGANFTLGYLSYDLPIVSSSGGLPVEIIAVAAVVALTFLTLLAASVWLCMKRRSIKTALKRLERELASYQQTMPPDITRSLNDQVDILSYNKAYEIDRNLVILTSRLLGAGEFGKIVQGERRMVDGKTVMPVAVKMVRDATDFHSIRSLADELKVMSHIRPHVNVLCLIGACTRDLEHHGLLVLTEFCEIGSLREYLIRNASIFNDFYANAISHGPIEKLLNYAFQAANGMVHLSASNVIHRDLALRNLLLTGKHVVKIADFGLSRQHIGCYQMSATSNTPLPIHWMAMESLSTGLYTNKSDVWSFGIVLWEIFSCGKLPYTRHTGGPAVFRDWLHESEDNRLGSPSIACDEMYQLMRRCWQKNPKSRPTFSECKSYISQYLQQRSPNSYHLLELLISDGWMTVAECHGNQAPSQLENAPETERLLTRPGHQGSDAMVMEVFDLNAEVDANGYQLPSSRKRMEAGNPQYDSP